MSNSIEVSIRMVHRHVVHHHHRLHAGGDAHHAANVAHEVLSECQADLHVVDEIAHHAEAEYAATYEQWHGRPPASERPVADHYQTSASRWMKVGGWALVIYESLLGALMSHWFLAFHPVVSGLIGVLLAILLSLGAKGAITTLLGRYAHTPVEAQDHLTGLLKYLAIAEVVLTLLFFWFRASADPVAVHLISLFGLTTAALSLVTPMLAGALFVGGVLYSWSARLHRIWSTAQHLHHQVQGAAQAAQRRLHGDSHDAGHGDSTGHGHLRAATAALIMIVLFARLSHAQCPAYRDWSRSVSQNEMEAAIRTFVNAVAADSGHACAAGEWTVIPFTSDAWTAEPVAHVIWPMPPVHNCGVVKYTEAESVFRNQREHRNTQHQHSCDSSHVAALNHWGLRSGPAAEALLVALQRPPAFHGSCTSLAALLIREAHAESERLAVLFTDGRETCRSALPTLQAPLSGARLIIVLVSPPGRPAHDGVEEFEHRRGALLKAAPWARVVTVWQLATELKMIHQKPGVLLGSVRQ